MRRMLPAALLLAAAATPACTAGLRHGAGPAVHADEQPPLELCDALHERVLLVDFVARYGFLEAVPAPDASGAYWEALTARLLERSLAAARDGGLGLIDGRTLVGPAVGTDRARCPAPGGDLGCTVPGVDLFRHTAGADGAELRRIGRLLSEQGGSRLGASLFLDFTVCPTEAGGEVCVARLPGAMGRAFLLPEEGARLAVSDMSAWGSRQADVGRLDLSSAVPDGRGRGIQVSDLRSVEGKAGERLGERLEELAADAVREGVQRSVEACGGGRR